MDLLKKYYISSSKFSSKHRSRSRILSIFQYKVALISFSSFCVLVTSVTAGTEGGLGGEDVVQTTTDSIIFELDTTEAFSDDLVSANIRVTYPAPSIRLSLVDATTGITEEIFSQDANETVIIPVDKYTLSLGSDLSTKVLRIYCTAQFPVRIVYEGSGAPFEITTRSFRHTKNFTDPTTYTFSAAVDLTRNLETNTGKYFCEPYNRNVSDSESVFVQLYSPGKTLFLSRPNKTIQLYSEDRNFTVPCPITDPSYADSVNLYQQTGDNSALVPVKFPVEFQINRGFFVEITEDLPINNFLGSYVCKSNKDDRKSIVYKVLPPKGSYVRVTPEVNYIKILPGVKQILKCEAKENITLTISGDRQPRIVDFEMDPSSEYPYVAFFEIHPTNITAEHTVINCVTANDVILHTWEYSTYVDVSISNFYFDGQKRYQDARYICCSDSYYKPKLEFIFCRSETECEFKKTLLDQPDFSNREQILGEYIDRVSVLNDSCVYFNPYLKYTLPSGLLRCSVHGISKSFYRDYIYYFNPYRVYQAFTDRHFDAEKVASSDFIMKVSKTPSRNVLVGQTQRFLCYYSELFFSNGVTWAVEMNNGSLHFLESEYDDSKSNSSFSQIELTFNETDVKSVECFAPIKESQTKWRHLTGPLFIRDPPKIRAYLQNTNGTFLKELDPENATNIILDEDILNMGSSNSVYEILNSSTTRLVLECNASFPVDFIYTGDLSPHLEFQSFRFTGPEIQNLTEYSYSAKVKFFRVDEQTVGKYSCVSATREFGNRGKDEDLKANLHLFVPADDLFISRDNQSFRLWEYRDSLLIPCLVNDPRPNITLLKLNNVTNNYEPLDSTEKLEYDPLNGFSLTKNHTKSLFGVYKCVGDRNRTSGLITVYLPSDNYKVTPYVKEIKVLGNETQSFSCTSKENVTLVFSDDIQREVTHSKNLSSYYPYEATYQSTLGEFTNLTLVNCTSLNDSKPLHTWELFPGDGSLVDSFVYDNSTKEMKCCTKSYRSPTIEWMNCSSVAECYMRQSSCLLQNKCQPADYTLTEGIDKANMKNNCLAISITEMTHGALKCTVKGVHKIVAQALVYYYNPEKDFEVHDGYFLGSKMFDKFTIENDIVMNLTSSKKGQNITSGEEVKFSCSGSKFFFSSEIKWGMEGANGTMEYLHGTDLTTYEEVRSEISILFDESAVAKWNKVYCFAPNWKEYYGWRNVSYSLNFIS